MRQVRDRVGPASTPGRFTILDALRGILALVVVLGHLGMPPVFGAIEQSDPVWGGLARLWSTFAFGPPAVIAFFVISGFCIHYPFAGVGQKLPVICFYLRRYLRIGIPIVAVVAILGWIQPGVVLFGEKSVLWTPTLWSVLCEEIYYALYPLLLLARLRVGMWPLLLVSSLSSVAVITSTFPAVDWSDLGVLGTSIVLLPVWLLGAIMAEWARNRTPSAEIRGFGISWWRAGAWGIMWLALVLHFHSGLHQTATSLVVGAFAFFWLRAEITNAAAPRPFLLRFGTRSYSLYLVHPLVIFFLYRSGIDAHASLAGWALTMASILAFSYLFFLLIEAPSHALARRVSLRVPEPLASIAQKPAE
jgi:peptidoglycan/LPS O-acetylase OafA/YrhL